VVEERRERDAERGEIPRKLERTREYAEIA
jgi:hypothetical protein